jgi:hypothetical protein
MDEMQILVAVPLRLELADWPRINSPVSTDSRAMKAHEKLAVIAPYLGLLTIDWVQAS